jgi:hypothetical protein
VVNPGNVLQDRPGNPYHIREYSPEEFETLLRSISAGWMPAARLSCRAPLPLLKLGGVNRKLPGGTRPKGLGLL